MLIQWLRWRHQRTAVVSWSKTARNFLRHRKAVTTWNAVNYAGAVRYQRLSTTQRHNAADIIEDEEALAGV